MTAWQPEGLGSEIFRNRHAFHPEETWGDACKRVAWHVANAEQGADRERYAQEFLDVLLENLFMPGGRTWYGAGRAKGQLLNCFVIGTEDSREGWGQTVSDSIVISGTGGGVGLNCSPIRPRGTPVKGTGGTATGAVSLMEIINAAGEVIKAGGGRRTALMLCLDIRHPDILEFLDAKLDLGRLNNANVSVVFSDDPERFFEAVRAGTPYDLVHGGRVVGQADARSVWDRVVANALRGGEPGILNMHLANRMSNIWYGKKLISTNPCGEIWLSEAECCCLGAVVLPRFVTPTGKVRWELLRSTVRTSVRFLDDVLTVNNYPLPKIARTCQDLRRIGLGVMGLHDFLLLQDLDYSSPEGLEMVDRVMRFIKEESYAMSVDLAVEKGPFPLFQSEGVARSGFIKSLRPTLRQRIEREGLRNCALNTIAPTGTTSMVAGVTSGVEPMFAPAYRRRWRIGDDLAEEVVVHPLLRRFVTEGRSVTHFRGAYDISLREGFEVQRACQRHVDNAISKTLQVRQGTSAEELSELYMEYLPELKGVTVYPEGSREDQPLSPLSLEEALRYISEEAASTAVAETPSCPGGACEL